MLSGEPRALRRIVGARRGGRWGALLAGIGLLLAAPPADWPALALAHAAFSALGLPLARRRALGVRENQRLLLWWVGAALALAAAPRVAGGSHALAWAVLALGIAHAGHARGLLRGFERPGEAEQAIPSRL